MTRFLATLTICVLAQTAPTRLTQAEDRPQPRTPVVPAINFSLLDLSGTTHNLDQNDTARVRVFVFLSTECPISNGYTNTLNDLHARFSGQDVDLFGVVVDSTVTRAQAAKHFAEFKTGFPILFDGSGLLLRALKPSHVPEAFVLDRDGRLVYRGAIDNAWEALGRRRPKAKREFLAEALAAALGGKEVTVAETKPVGCLIETPPKGDEQAKVTYARDIAPIIHTRCLNCHREGQVAPFALADYEQTAKRAQQIVQVTQDRLMPPWIPSPGHDKFVGERWLTDRELELFKTWAETGRAKGDDADLPPAPKFAEGWRLGQPDLIVNMPEPFTVPADGPDLLQNFVIPLDIPEDKLVAGIEFHPGNKRVAHHAVLFLDDNSADNPSNPSSPPKRVTWGDGTTDEMLFCFFLLSAEKTEDLITVIFDNLKHDMQQPRKVVRK